MTIDPKVLEARDVLYDAVAWSRHADASLHATADTQKWGREQAAIAFDALLSAVRTAHLQELAGETEEETLNDALEAFDRGPLCDNALADDHDFQDCRTCTINNLREAAKVITAPLRAKLQQAVAAEREKYCPILEAVKEWREARLAVMSDFSVNYGGIEQTKRRLALDHAASTLASLATTEEG